MSHNEVGLRQDSNRRAQPCWSSDSPNRSNSSGVTGKRPFAALLAENSTPKLNPRTRSSFRTSQSFIRKALWTPRAVSIMFLACWSPLYKYSERNAMLFWANGTRMHSQRTFCQELRCFAARGLRSQPLELCLLVHHWNGTEKTGLNSKSLD